MAAAVLPGLLALLSLAVSSAAIVNPTASKRGLEDVGNTLLLSVGDDNGGGDGDFHYEDEGDAGFGRGASSYLGSLAASGIGGGNDHQNYDDHHSLGVYHGKPQIEVLAPSHSSIGYSSYHGQHVKSHIGYAGRGHNFLGGLIPIAGLALLGALAAAAISHPVLLELAVLGNPHHHYGRRRRRRRTLQH